MKKYLVVHPKLSVVIGGDGRSTPLNKGEEVALDSALADNLVRKGFLKLVVAEKKVDVEPKPKAKPKAKKAKAKKK